MASELRVAGKEGRWRLVGEGAEDAVALVNDYLDYLADRNYSPQTVRAYAFALLAFCRWLSSEGIQLEAVTTDGLLRFLAACRQATVPGRPGPNVVRMDGRRVDGYAPATVNHRLAAISGLFAFRSLRHPEAKNPVPRGKEARRLSAGERAGLDTGPRSACASRAGSLDRSIAGRSSRCWEASAPGGTGPSLGSWCSAGCAPERSSPCR